MLTHSLKPLTVGAALLLAATGVWAQTSTPAASNPQPATETRIGVSPAEAQEAREKASPQSDTGTLVRTAPSATERAEGLVDDAKRDADDRDRVTSPPSSSPDAAGAVNSPRKAPNNIDASPPTR